MLPWTAEHYLDPDIPGSLVAEILPTMRYIEALWERVHGRFGANDDPVIYTYPDAPHGFHCDERQSYTKAAAEAAWPRALAFLQKHLKK